jgi:hypothetical protein
LCAWLRIDLFGMTTEFPSGCDGPQLVDSD